MNSQRGFSYIWALILLAILSMGLGKAAEVTSHAVQRQRERTLIAIGNEFRQAIGSYYEQALQNGTHQYPSNLSDLIKDPRFPEVKRHLRRIYIDPFTGKAEWGVVLIDGRIVGVHSLSTAASIKRSGFGGGNIRFNGKERVAEWCFVYPADLTYEAIRAADTSN